MDRLPRRRETQSLEDDVTGYLVVGMDLESSPVQPARQQKYLNHSHRRA